MIHLLAKHIKAHAVYTQRLQTRLSRIWSNIPWRLM